MYDSTSVAEMFFQHFVKRYTWHDFQQMARDNGEEIPKVTSAAHKYLKSGKVNLLLASCGINSPSHRDYARHCVLIVVDMRGRRPQMTQLDPMHEKMYKNKCFSGTMKLAQALKVKPTSIRCRMMNRQTHTQDCIYQCLLMIIKIREGSLEF